MASLFLSGKTLSFDIILIKHSFNKVCKQNRDKLYDKNIIISLQPFVMIARERFSSEGRLREVSGEGALYGI